MEVNPMNFKSSVLYNRKVEQANTKNPANPLRLKANLSSLAALSSYNQVTTKPKFDYDSMEILTKVDALSKLIPQELNIPYSFNPNEINGERINSKDGKLLCIREYDNEIVRDYIPAKNGEKISQIIERDRQNGSIISKIEKVQKENEEKINLTLYDEKINDKYIMYQITNGNIGSITEFSANGKKFRTLIKDVYTNKPQRYMEAKEDEQGEFVFTDAKLSSNLNISEIKKISSNKEVCIRYEGANKIVDVKNKFIEN